MADNMPAATTKNSDHQVFAIDHDGRGSSSLLDDDGRPKRSGTFMTASAHIVTAVIGSGVLSLAWAMAQLGWAGGPIAMILFSIVTWYTSSLLSSCYRTGDIVSGKRNYTYMDAVRSYLGGWKVKFCGIIQYANLVGVAIGYTIASALSMMAVQKAGCLHSHGGSKGEVSCKMNSNPYMIGFGVAQIVLSQIPDFDQLWWLSYVASVMSFTYSTIGLALGITKVAENGWKFRGSLTGVPIGTITESEKIWRTFQSLGNIAFAYSFSVILIEIQDTIKSPPSESKTMKKAALLSVIVTTIFYMLCGCFGYAAFGDMAPGNLLTGFGYFNPYWVLDIANVAIIVHLVGAYQVFVQPLYAFVEKRAIEAFPGCKFLTKEILVPIPGSSKPYKLNLFRLTWRTVFVVFTTLISMLLPFFSDVVGLLGALGFWPLTVFFPVEMYIVQMRIAKWSSRWVALQILSMTCLVVSLMAAAGSIYSISNALKVYKPFKASY
uniref:Amino acid transporter transmembrane domain-containing protein n=1 Tax=Kalanchoe fedtschenkoi TaxID=63787 RepID=A0A7N0T5C4_KALFE